MNFVIKVFPDLKVKKILSIRIFPAENYHVIKPIVPTGMIVWNFDL